MSDDYVHVKAEALSALLKLYDVHWNQIGTYDPGRELVSDGVRLHDIASLISIEDSRLLEEACEAIEPHVEHIQSVLSEWAVTDG